MFDFDAGKLMIIATVALVVIGPKDLPRVLRQLGQMVTRVKRMAGDFQNQFMDAMKEADIQELRDEVAKLKDTATLDVDFNPAKDIKTHLDEAMGTHVPTPNFGSTSEMTPPRLAAASGVEPSAVGDSVVGVPVADVPLQASPEPTPAIEPPADEVMAAPSPKSVVVRRRVASRHGAMPGRPAGWHRSRNILPARRETPDQ